MTPSDADLFATLTMQCQRFGLDYGILHTCTFYKSSDIATRGFCRICGTQMSFESTRWPCEIHLFAISLDDPQKYEPQLHCHYAERVEWLNTVDALPKQDGSAEID